MNFPLKNVKTIKQLKEEYLKKSNQVRIQQYKSVFAIICLYTIGNFSSYCCNDLILLCLMFLVKSAEIMHGVKHSSH